MLASATTTTTKTPTLLGAAGEDDTAARGLKPKTNYKKQDDDQPRRQPKEIEDAVEEGEEDGGNNKGDMTGGKAKEDEAGPDENDNEEDEDGRTYKTDHEGAKGQEVHEEEDEEEKEEEEDEEQTTFYDTSQQGSGGGSLLSTAEPKGPPQACLFVASLSPDTSEDTLHELFAQHGEVMKIKLLRDRASRPYAFVQYSDADEANRALALVNGVALDGRRLRVEKAKVNRTLFLAKMNRSLSNLKLREVAEAYGPVESATVIKHHQTQKSKGCGFVKFVFREDAMAAYLGLKNQYRKWVVEWATSGNDPDVLGVDKLNVFVGGLNPHRITRAALEQRFAVYGHVEAVTLINRADTVAGLDPLVSPSEDPSVAAPQRNAFAFVRFQDAASSAAAIEHENGAEWLERRIRVQYCESPEMKNKRRTQKYFNNLAAAAAVAHAVPLPYAPAAAAGWAPYVSPAGPFPAGSVLMMGGMPVYVPEDHLDSPNAQRYGGGAGGRRPWEAAPIMGEAIGVTGPGGYGAHYHQHHPQHHHLHHHPHHPAQQQQQQPSPQGGSPPAFYAYPTHGGPVPLAYSPSWAYESSHVMVGEQGGLGYDTLEEGEEDEAWMQQQPQQPVVAEHGPQAYPADLEDAAQLEHGPQPGKAQLTETTTQERRSVP